MRRSGHIIFIRVKFTCQSFLPEKLRPSFAVSLLYMFFLGPSLQSPAWSGDTFKSRVKNQNTKTFASYHITSKKVVNSCMLRTSWKT